MQLRLTAPSLLAVLFLTACQSAGAAGGRTDPLGKVLDLLEGLSKKLKKDAAAEEKAYKEYAAWCEDTFRNTGFEIEAATQQQQKKEAKISELASEIQVRTSKIEELAASVSGSQTALDEATALRQREEADFLASEQELVRVIGTIERASAVLQRELRKNAGSFAQLDGKSTQAVLESLGLVVQAATFSINDRRQLVALLQEQEDAMDDEAGPPSAAAYKSRGGSIVELLADLKEKAQVQLGELRKIESNAKFNYDRLKQSLDLEIATSTRNLADEKSGKASAEEGKAVAEGDLSIAKEQLRVGREKLESTQTNCQQVAKDHEETVSSRAEELKAVHDAVALLRESAGASSPSFLQLSMSAGSTSSARSVAAATEAPDALARQDDVAAMVRRLAQQHHSAALAQLASRIAAVARFGASGGVDPFEKVRQLIQGLIVQLEKEAREQASEKSYCDSELKKTQSKKDQLGDNLAKLSAKVDESSAKTAELKGQVAQLQAEISVIAREQAEMEGIRRAAHTDYVATKRDLEKGLAGVRKALGVLRSYYASAGGGAALLQDQGRFAAFMRQPATPEKHEKSSGAGVSIIGFLEVIESDLAKSLSKEEAMESDAQIAFDKQMQENKVNVAAKEKDVQYKTQGFKEMDKNIAEMLSDRDTLNAENAAVLEYWGKLQERCVAKPDTYEQRSGRRNAEISGLKQALSALGDQAALLQRQSRRSALRGATLAP